jgi:hypothetical protein
MEISMARILLVGLDPDTVDYSDPALPPGMNAEKVRAGIAVAVQQFTERGWESDLGYIHADDTAGPTVAALLRSANYDCVVIGAGVRLPPRHLALLEALIHTIRHAAPGAAIAFNTRPDDSAVAAARGLELGRQVV